MPPAEARSSTIMVSGPEPSLEPEFEHSTGGQATYSAKVDAGTTRERPVYGDSVEKLGCEYFEAAQTQQ